MTADKQKHTEIKWRNDQFSQRASTRIWHEIPSDNPYVAKECLCHGYAQIDLMRQRSYVDILYLLFLGELPSHEQSKILETLMIALINPGPRHAATRAAMSAGISRSNTAHILPIALSVLGGEHLGGMEVTGAMRFLQQNQVCLPTDIATEMLSHHQQAINQGDLHIAPGFGRRFGDIDPLVTTYAAELATLPGIGNHFRWAETFVNYLKDDGMGWLSSGLAAAIFIDLGLPPRAGAGLFQLLCAPGLLAHGLEQADKPLTDMPFIDEEHYVIAPDARHD